jgi:hypothetical protein
LFHRIGSAIAVPVAAVARGIAFAEPTGASGPQMGHNHKPPRRSMLNSTRPSDPETKVAVVRALYDAYVNKDRAAIEPLLADAFHFSSPLDNRIDRATYFERCWPNSDQIEGFDFVTMVPAGNRVLVIYEGRGKGGKRFRNTEVCLFQGRQVIEVEVYFGWTIPHEAPPGSFIS